jgi:hypothetical protein
VWFALYGALDALAGEKKATTEDFVDVFRREGGLDEEAPAPLSCAAVAYKPNRNTR